ncbi:GDSL esterase/lipase [Quillaja saponaria]|uniref:GDSL esterase/lipase n=1 Tax=Quillaja saponaria TaxID=32244 RepID=A0AAD7PJI0_QUISA|nr:GDSL esterase/lipase [Quillaja saponaria]
MQQVFVDILLKVVLILFLGNRAQANGTIPAVFAFGDSILDTGNNNNLNTVTKCNFPPYGRDFPGGIPTGRFCNGKVPSDLIAAGLHIKETLPAYLDPNLKNEDLPTGVGFASGGSGNDNLTANIQGVLTLSEQLRLFKEYIGKLKESVGEDKANGILSNSLYLLSAGNNDIAISYSVTERRTQYDFPSYAALLVGWTSDFLKALYGLGARRIAVLSTLPLGCLPGARSIGGFLRPCIELVNQEAQLFNSKLSSELDSIKNSIPDFKLIFVDVYTSLLDIIQNPEKSGFTNVANGCCGTGTFEIGVYCNQFSLFTCASASSYVFWDSGHPTQKAYEIIVSNILQKYNISSF